MMETKMQIKIVSMYRVWKKLVRNMYYLLSRLMKREIDKLVSLLL